MTKTIRASRFLNHACRMHAGHAYCVGSGPVFATCRPPSRNLPFVHGSPNRPTPAVAIRRTRPKTRKARHAEKNSIHMPWASKVHGDQRRPRRRRSCSPASCTGTRRLCPLGPQVVHKLVHRPVCSRSQPALMSLTVPVAAVRPPAPTAFVDRSTGLGCSPAWSCRTGGVPLTHR